MLDRFIIPYYTLLLGKEVCLECQSRTDWIWENDWIGKET